MVPDATGGMSGAAAAAPSVGVLTVLFAKGGMGDVGRHVVAQALQRHGAMRVRAVARPEDMALLDAQPADAEARLERIELDPATDGPGLEKAVSGADAVVSCIGNRQPGFERWGAAGTRNLVGAMSRAGVNRVVAISSVGVKSDFPPMPWCWQGYLFGAMLMTIVRSAYRDISALEKALATSSLDYVLVRPTGLEPTEVPVKSYRLVDRNARPYPKEFTIAKEDCALFMLDQIFAPTLSRTAVTLVKPPPAETAAAAAAASSSSASSSK